MAYILNKTRTTHLGDLFSAPAFNKAINVLLGHSSLTKNVMIAQSHSNVPVSHDDEHNTGTMDLTSAQWSSASNNVHCSAATEANVI